MATADGRTEGSGRVTRHKEAQPLRDLTDAEVRRSIDEQAQRSAELSIARRRRRGEFL